MRLRAELWCVLGGFALAAVQGLGQSASPASAADGSRGGQAQTQQGAPGAVPTVKTSAQLVIVDVVVTDGAQKPVHGLTAADFKLMENGAPQTVKNFEEHTAPTAADATKFAPMPKMPPGIFTNYSPAPANGAVDLILLDTLNTPLKDQAYVRQQLLKYLNAVPPGTRIAIFGLTDHLIVLQGFTTDPEVLKAVVAKGKGKGSPLLDDQVGGGGIQNSEADDMEDMGADPEIVANMREFDAQTQSFQLQLRAKYTLDAMNQIARYLSVIPGRKNLIWFSGSFPVDVLPDTTGNLPDPFIAMASSEDEFRETVDLLGRSQVAVYPIDARGLMNSPVMDASTTRNYAGSKGIARMQQDNSAFFTSQAQEHGTMLTMASATGGHAFVDTNDLTRAVATAVVDGANFYTLAYTPTNPVRDGKLRKIKVQVTRPGANLAYRQGYYADDPEKVSQEGRKADAAEASGGMSPREVLRLAMMRGAPTPTDIVMKVGVVPITPKGQTEDKPADGNIPAAKTKPPYRRYSVNYAIDPADITFMRMPDGKVHADFELIIFAMTADGQLVNSTQSEVRIAMPLEQIRQMVSQYGLVRHEEISTPAKGEYFLRIAVHDMHHDSYGAVEVATSSVQNVVPPSMNQGTPAAAKQ